MFVPIFFLQVQIGLGSHQEEQLLAQEEQLLAQKDLLDTNFPRFEKKWCQPKMVSTIFSLVRIAYIVIFAVHFRPKALTQISKNSDIRVKSLCQAYCSDFFFSVQVRLFSLFPFTHAHSHSF